VSCVRGTLGPMTGGAWIRFLSQAGLSGTLLLGKGEANTLFVLQEGRVQGWDIGAPYRLSEVGGRFVFWPHAKRPQPSFEARYPEAAGPLRALPALFEDDLFSTAEVDVRALFARLAQGAFGGAVVFERPHALGVVVLVRGRPATAALETRTELLYGPAALRPLMQADEAAALRLYPLPEPLCSSFLALVLASQKGGVGGAATEAATGTLVSDEGYAFMRGGEVYLELLTPPALGSGFVPACETPPNLPLPSDLAGWEGRHYALTLRGRDALDPMTELSMRFRAEFGRTGQRLLEGFRRAAAAEAVAAALGLEEGAFRTLLGRLEAEGFIRRLEGR
jgi:hypothetical protein